MERDDTPFLLETLPEGVPSIILSFATHDLEITERCQFELVSKPFTKFLNSGEGHEKWYLVKLWKLIHVKGVSWSNRWEGFSCFKNFQIERARYNEILKGGNQGEKMLANEIKTTLRECLDKACTLRDPFALSAKIDIYFKGLYGYPKDTDAAMKISSEEQASGGMPMCADILYFKCEDPWPLKKMIRCEIPLEESHLDANTVRCLRENGVTTTFNLTKVIDTEKNYQAVEVGVKNCDVEFLNLKLRFILEGVGGYKKNYEAARQFLIKPYADSF